MLASMVDNNGGTFIVEAMELGNVRITEPVAGYVVGGRGVSWVQTAVFTAAQIEAFIWEQDEFVPAFGGWLDSETGKWWLDSVDIIDDFHRAIALAKARGELAICCLHTGDIVYLRDVEPGNAKPLGDVIGEPLSDKDVRSE